MRIRSFLAFYLLACSSIFAGIIIHEAAHLIPIGADPNIAAYDTHNGTVQQLEGRQLGDHKSNIRIYMDTTLPFVLSLGLYRPGTGQDVDTIYATAHGDIYRDDLTRHQTLIAPILAAHMYQTVSLLLVALMPAIWNRAMLYGSSITMGGAVLHVIQLSETSNPTPYYLTYGIMIAFGVAYAVLQPMVLKAKARHLVREARGPVVRPPPVIKHHSDVVVTKARDVPEFTLIR